MRLDSLDPLLSIPVGSPPPPSQATKRFLEICGADLKNKNCRSGGVQSICSRPVDDLLAPSFVVEFRLPPAQCPPRKKRVHRGVARGGACLRARTSQLNIAAPLLLPETTRES